MFRIEMIPAKHGDALLIEYGKASAPRRILIDGGPIGAWGDLSARLARLPAGDRRFELVVMTHVDTDHVEGLVRLFADPKPTILPMDVWFNGWRHLSTAHRLLGAMQGEFLSALLARRLPAGRWNKAFGGKAVVVPAKGKLPVRELEGKMRLTLLSPTPETMAAMAKEWKKKVAKGFDPGDLDRAWELLSRKKQYLPKEGLLGSTPALEKLLDQQMRIVDQSKANGSSIAFLAEHGKASCLFLADAHHDVVAHSLKRLLKERGLKRLKVSAVKLSHHGSKNNVSDELLSLIESPRFLVSTNGDIFQHPDELAMQRVIVRSVHQPPTLYFNCASATTRPWATAARRKKLGHVAVLNKTKDPLLVEL